MVINGTQAYDKIWDWVYETLHFHPSGLDQGHDFPYGPPFRIPFPYAVYGIERMEESQQDRMEELVRQALLNVTGNGQRLYGLDWQHSGFLFDPRSPDAYQSQWVADERYPGGGYHAFFPLFYPDGDYCFFIAESLEFGCLSHPWRKEVWIFGEALVAEFERLYPELGWYKLDWQS